MEAPRQDHRCSCPDTTPSLAALTRRQREVAALIAEGLTDGEIAWRLTLTTGTAKNHVAGILRRLNLRNRVQLAVWAVKQGLY